MATYISLISFTQRGSEDVKNTIARAAEFSEVAAKSGATVQDVYWTLGNHDGVLVFDAPSEEIAAALILGLGARGNVRTETLRAFDTNGIQAVLDNVN